MNIEFTLLRLESGQSSIQPDLNYGNNSLTDWKDSQRQDNPVQKHDMFATGNLIAMSRFKRNFELYRIHLSHNFGGLHRVRTPDWLDRWLFAEKDEMPGELLKLRKVWLSLYSIARMTTTVKFGNGKPSNKQDRDSKGPEHQIKLWYKDNHRDLLSQFC